MRKIIAMKKTVGILLMIFMGIIFTSCGKEESVGQNSLQVYYVSNSETKVEMHAHQMASMDSEAQLEELIECLSTNPEKLEYKAPFVMGFQLLDVKRDGGRVQLNVDAAYLELSPITEILVRAAIVRTLTQLKDVSHVGITVEGNQLYDSMGNLVGWMSAEQFINNNGNEINTYEEVRVKLYFAGEDGTNLIAAFREKHYSTNTPLERFVLEELIAGPKVEGLYPSINPATKIISVMTKDGICYVNLDENFLTVQGNVSTDISIYSIVNSLVELNGINKVQILINGEVPAIFPMAVFERNLDIVTTREM